jgi:hypothetical protein
MTYTLPGPSILISYFPVVSEISLAYSAGVLTPNPNEGPTAGSGLGFMFYICVQLLV